MDKKNGSVEWFCNTEGLIHSYTKTLQNKVYCGDDKGFLYILNAGKREVINKYHIGKPVLTKPLIDDKKILVGCKGSFYCINDD